MQLEAAVRQAEAQGRSRDTTANRPERAQQKLKGYVAEIAETPKGARAKTLYGRAKDMGKMVGANWIDEGEVFDALLQAAEKCGFARSESRRPRRHWRVSELSSFSAMFSQLPCLGV